MTKKEQITDTNEAQDSLQSEPIDEEIIVSLESEDTSSEDKPKNKQLLLRIGVFGILIATILLMVWGIFSLIFNGSAATPEPTTYPTETAVALPADVATPAFSTEGQSGGVVRQPVVHVTSIPTPEDRDVVTTYVVETGDTIFGIAEKFGLKPETVLWSNRYILGDTPDGLTVGLELNILPVDGVYHMWSEGEGLNGVSSFYGVDPDVIVNYSGNNLDPETVGDYANPNIAPGTMLVVPDGTRPTIAWVVARDAPASGNSYLGPGACGGIIYGNVGTGSFTWPTTATWLSGYDYTPPTHNGLDFDGDFGSPIYAADSGVIVYSGWSDRGYGNLIVVDHAGGWQTFYAHLLDGTLLPCGSNVQKGELIASMGSTGNSTGPHLHFEMRLEGYPVNPWDFLY